MKIKYSDGVKVMDSLSVIPNKSLKQLFEEAELQFLTEEQEAEKEDIRNYTAD